MTETTKKEKVVRPKRPFFLTFMCIIGFTYTILFSVLFLIGILYSSGLSGIVDKYLQLYDLSRLNSLIISVSLFLVFFTSFLGVFMMWKMQKLGFYIYLTSVLVFLVLEISFAGFYLPDIMIHLLLIILFLIAFPFGKKRRLKLLNKKLLKLG
ncbi:MAG: hypothetical protein V2I47_03375 [Bacteroidales bacterium]|jgi:hypothetical protein|nr:hypothetical protein [Bacteroidales bacterium]